MRSRLLASTALVLFSTAAAAEHNWSGFYIGGHVGGGSPKAHWSDVDFIADVVDFDLDESVLIYGGYAGANLQLNNWVIGAEADFSAIDAERILFDGPEGIDFLSDLNNFGSVRGRVGWTMDRLLIYGTGGYAFADSDHIFDGPQGFGSFSLDNGWVGGGGLEFAVTRGLSVRGEGLYYDFGEDSAAYAFGFLEADQKLFIGRAGISYKFLGL